MCKSKIKTVLAAATVGVIGLLARSASASMTLNLAFADGSTQYQLTPADWGTTIPINVWATVTTSTPISANNHDGLQFLYLDVLSSVPYGGPSAPGGSTAVDGQLVSAASSDLFSANGSQNGEITDANGDGVMDVGPLTSPRTVVPQQQLTLLAKPRSGSPVWDTTSAYDPTEVVVNGDSVSFLVETIGFSVNTDDGIETDLDPLIPDITPPYVDANWFEDDPTTTGGSVGVQYTKTAPYLAGTGVQIFGNGSATVPEPASLSLLAIGAVSLLARRRARRNLSSI